MSRILSLLYCLCNLIHPAILTLDSNISVPIYHIEAHNNHEDRYRGFDLTEFGCSNEMGHHLSKSHTPS